MTTGTLKFQEAVNKLIEACHDGKNGFAAAAKAVSAEEPLLKAELMQYSHQRADFAEDLEHEMVLIGEEPVHHGTVSGAMHRGWMNLKNAVAESDRHGVLTECLRGEASAIEAYWEALSAELPALLENVVRLQMAAIERVHNRIQILCGLTAPQT